MLRELPGRALQLDDVAFRIAEVERRPFTLRTEARFNRSRRHAMRNEIRLNARFIERLQAHTEVIEVEAFRSRRGAAHCPKLAVYRNEIDERTSSAQLDQAEVVAPSFDSAAEHIAIERQHRVEIADAQYEVIDVADGDWRRLCGQCFLSCTTVYAQLPF